jgi:hypothetical protein
VVVVGGNENFIGVADAATLPTSERTTTAEAMILDMILSPGVNYQSFRRRRSSYDALP